MPEKLNTMDAETLLATPFPPLKFVVEEFMSQGLHLLAGSPKIGGYNFLGRHFGCVYKSPKVNPSGISKPTSVSSVPLLGGQLSTNPKSAL